MGGLARASQWSVNLIKNTHISQDSKQPKGLFSSRWTICVKPSSAIEQDSFAVWDTHGTHAAVQAAQTQQRAAISKYETQSNLMVANI